MTGEPPSFTGAVKEIVASVFPTATVKEVGGFGTVEGVAEADATDSAKVEVVLSSAYGTSQASYTYARTSVNGGTVTVSNSSSFARTIETVILRIG